MAESVDSTSLTREPGGLGSLAAVRAARPVAGYLQRWA